MDTKSKIQHVVVTESELLELPSPNYNCNICGMKVKTKSNLRAHQIKTHKIVKNEKDVAFFSKQKNNMIYVYHCPVALCRHNLDREGGFSTYSRLKQHYQHVHMLKVYQCTKCSQSFSTPSSYAYHERFCGLVFICPVCARSYCSRKHLMQHFRRTQHMETSLLDRRVSKHGNLPSESKSCPPAAFSEVASSSVVNEIPPQQSSLDAPPIIVPLIVLPVILFGCASHPSSLEPNNMPLSYASSVPSTVNIRGDSELTVMSGTYCNQLSNSSSTSS